MRPLLILPLLLAPLIFFPAQAQTKQEKIHELILVTEVPERMKHTIDTLWPMIVAEGMEINPDIPKDVWNQVGTAGKQEFAKSLPDVVEEFEKLYDMNFSEPEIEAVLAFYKTPTGNSIMHKLNDMAPQTAALGQAWGSAVSRKVIARISEEMHNKGYDVRL